MFRLKRYFFINTFYSKILDHSYLLFISKNNLKFFNSFDLVTINSNDFMKLKINKKKVFLKKDIYLLNLNFISNNLNLRYIDYISYLGFFLNGSFKNKFINYFKFYKNNYNLFLYLIHLNLNLLKYILYFMIFKVIYILNLLKIDNKNKKE